jgi:hypothetical protein
MRALRRGLSVPRTITYKAAVTIMDMVDRAYGASEPIAMGIYFAWMLIVEVVACGVVHNA